MNFDIQTGYIRLTAAGDGGVIVRKGKKIKIPSGGKEVPTLETGDSIVAGKDTLISINTSYDKGRDRPVDKPTHKASKSITMWPESELRIGEVETWERIESKSKKKYFGAKFGEVELIKGTFSCSYYVDDDKLITPVAEIVFKKAGGSAIIDLYQGNLYSNPMATENLLLGSDSKGEVEFTNRKTKKSYTVKNSAGICEVIVTDGAIYKKSYVRMDKFFLDYTFGTPMRPEMVVNSSLVQNAPMGNYSDVGKIMEQGMASLEMFKSMSPEDLERLMSMGGQKVTKEQLAQVKELPAMAKMMEKDGYMEQMKKASAMVKGMGEGIGDEGMASMARFQKEASAQWGDLSKKSADMYKKAARAPRNYGPLQAESKVA